MTKLELLFLLSLVLPLVNLVELSSKSSSPSGSEEIKNNIKTDMSFEEFVIRFHKNYTKNDLDDRRRIFLNRSNFIQRFNEQSNRSKSYFRLGINHLADMNDSELMRCREVKPTKTLDDDTTIESELKYPINWIVYPKRSVQKRYPLNDLPENQNWSRYFGPVREQGCCGSCYAIATVDTIQASKRIFGGLEESSHLDWSVQQMIDCARDNISLFGCKGGWPPKLFQYLRRLDIVSLEKSYPYEGEEKKCKLDDPNHKLSFGVVGSNESLPGFEMLTTEEQIKFHVANTGPVVAVMQVTRSHLFTFYSSGVFEDSECNGEPNHAVIVVGYGTEGGKDYWLIRNSWGPDYGLGGYMKLARGKGTCSIGICAWVVTKFN